MLRLCFVVVFTVVIVVVVDALPQPKLRHLNHGGFEVSIEVDGDLKHGKADVNVTSGRKIKYTLVGTQNGKRLVSSGRMKTGETGVSVVPQNQPSQGWLVFRDDFDGPVSTDNWEYEVSMYGGYNWEIQVYTSDQLNVFTRNGNLFLKPTLTSEKFGEHFLHHGTMDVRKIWGSCTNADRWGCVREGRNGILPPVMSGKLKSKKTIKFGRVNVRARIPQGDWIWPAIWMLPRHLQYGGWPASGEIDIMESRGNSFARDPSGNDHGRNEIGATLHWGPSPSQNRWELTHAARTDGSFSNSFHLYSLDWTVDHIIVSVDNQEVLRVPIGSGGFWQKGGFHGHNPWGSGSKAAPFDTAFYLILNVAIGGTNGFFPDTWTYNSRKPYWNNSPNINQNFWDARNEWRPSWQGDNVAMEVDYVEMFQY
ncbi:beta-1,3-glucan-binding protein-like [Dreissena polymorpha]|nr:beta-1,3-glucan-binding protein-like [Dreissena polymorpha]